MFISLIVTFGNAVIVAFHKAHSSLYNPQITAIMHYSK